MRHLAIRLSMIDVPANVAALSDLSAHLLTALYLITLMFSMGLELGGEAEDKQTKRRQRRWLVRALLVNLIALPAIAIAVTRAFHPSPGVVAALVLLAATPGGRFAPQLARLARANRALSVEIALFLFKVVPFTAPLVVKWLLGTRPIDIHDLPLIAKLLVLQMLPYLLGKTVRRHRGTVADRLTRPMHVVSTILLIAILAVVLLRRDLGALWLFKGHDWLSVLVCAAASLAVGWLAGGRTPTTRRSFAISANARNLALALMIAKLAFANLSNEVDVVAIWAVFVGVDYAFAALCRRSHVEVVSRPAAAAPGVPVPR